MELHVSFMFCTVIAISQLARSPEQYRERILFLGSLVAKMAQRHSFTETGPGSKIRLVLVPATYLACTQSEGTFHSSSPPSNLSTRFPSRRRAANFKSNLFPCQGDPRAMNTVTTMYKVSVPIYIHIHIRVLVVEKIVRGNDFNKLDRFSSTPFKIRDRRIRDAFKLLTSLVSHPINIYRSSSVPMDV